MKNKIGLIILDGWGIGAKDASDAIHTAKTPYFDSLIANHGNATLKTYGESVGLPEGQMGNSEVGHLNIGAGRIVYQELTRINKSIENKSFYDNESLNQAFQIAKTENKKVHLIGLVSNGGVHSSQEHLHALCKMAEMHEHHRTFVHAFTDGRDCDPQSGLGFIEKLTSFIKNRPIKIATIIGRYYAMDRDNRWERIKKAYDLMVHGKGSSFETSEASIKASYMHGITDEFIEPILIEKDGLIEKGDVVICFNFRSDRPREITTALTQRDFPELEMNTMDLHYFCMTRYDEAFKNVNIIFDKDNLQNTLGQVLAEHNKTQVRIAETEKYPHVTFFFNGGREIPFKNEHRILVNSPKVATYDLQPEMSAPEVKKEITQYIEKASPDFICLNFANPDMVGHTGVFSAIVSAVETVDGCLEEIVSKGTQLGYEFIVIADHGNADLAINDDMSPNTAHTTNPVPIIFISEQNSKLKNGKLADIAPTILNRLNIAIPNEMDGENLIF